MPYWIVAAALGTVAITALLTFVLWRMNAPMREPEGNRNERVDRSDDGAIFPVIIAGSAASGADERDGSDGTSDGSGGDGGGGDGGGGS